MSNCPPPAILIVEDEPLIRMNAVEILEELDAEVLEAADADEAIRALNCHPGVCLLFTDINMPGSMDGIALAAHVHATHPDIGLIVTSGGQNLKNAQLPDSGTFLPKPYRHQQLLDLARKKLASKG